MQRDHGCRNVRKLDHAVGPFPRAADRREAASQQDAVEKSPELIVAQSTVESKSYAAFDDAGVVLEIEVQTLGDEIKKSWQLDLAREEGLSPLLGLGGLLRRSNRNQRDAQNRTNSPGQRQTWKAMSHRSRRACAQV